MSTFFFISYLEQLFDSNTATSKLDIDIKDQTRLLRDFSDICCDSENEGALQNEAISKCANVRQLLPQQSKSIQKRGQYHRTRLHSAASNNNRLLAHLLLQNNADIEAKDEYNQTPLTISVSTNSVEVA